MPITKKNAPILLCLSILVIILLFTGFILVTISNNKHYSYYTKILDKGKCETDFKYSLSQEEGLDFPRADYSECKFIYEKKKYPERDWKEYYHK